MDCSNASAVAEADGAAMLRFFGLNPGQMSAEQIHKHAATLLGIPSYARRWAERRAEQAGLLDRFMGQLKPQGPALPAGRSVSVPEHEPAEVPPLDEPAPPTAAQGELLIHYMDAQGQRSKRRISVHTVRDHYGDDAIHAWCHERHDMRTFLISRVEEAVDLETGEIIEDLYEWFEQNMPGALDAGGDQEERDEFEADDALGAAVCVLVFIARADGRMVQAERDVIRSFIVMALSAMDLELLSHSELDKRISHISADFPTFKLALEELKELPERMRAGICGVADAVIRADGKRHYFEMEAMRTLREILEV